MTVKELVEFLKLEDPDADVLVQSEVDKVLYTRSTFTLKRCGLTAEKGKLRSVLIAP